MNMLRLQVCRATGQLRTAWEDRLGLPCDVLVRGHEREIKKEVGSAGNSVFLIARPVPCGLEHPIGKEPNLFDNFCVQISRSHWSE
jgi:hypothetical protein